MKLLLISMVFVSLPSIGYNQTGDMIYVEGGSYIMGAMDDRTPSTNIHPHEVILDDFYIGKYQVTVAEFREFVNETNHVTDCEKSGGGTVWLAVDRQSTRYHDTIVNWRYVGYVPENNQPVTFVSWYDAVNFCNWKSRKEKLEPSYQIHGEVVYWNQSSEGYRLLTEAEWEYAARCRGKNYKYTWGNDTLPYIDGKKAANIKDKACQRAVNSEIHALKGYDDGYIYSSPVGSFAPNELGVFDMTGNVYEWCWDWYDELYYFKSPIQNPVGPDIGEERVCRNIGFACPLIHMGTTSRGSAEPGFFADNVGFRIGKTFKRK